MSPAVCTDLDDGLFSRPCQCVLPILDMLPGGDSTKQMIRIALWPILVIMGDESSFFDMIIADMHESAVAWGLEDGRSVFAKRISS